uniref:Peroxidase n=1 Tax=Kalanchoe fedtschenkoi TaxID=63787 RepID=A0A7N0SZ22_KALFE
MRSNFYFRTCRQAETIVRQLTWQEAQKNPSLGAQILRVHYHDCFVRGCDASILLDTVGSTPSEKDARPNLTLLGFDLIDEIKTAVEEVCPGVVSCADILALSARDAVSFPFRRPLWPVFTGRRDGRVSLASEANSTNLPSPFSNFTTLAQLFDSKGLNLDDLVALSGAHTLGRAHCGAFLRRLNFTGNNDIDPTLDLTYAAFLKTQCPTPVNTSTTVEMDPRSSLRFDTSYYSAVARKKGLFQSDAALLADPASAKTVRKFQNEWFFFSQFSKSMVKMGAIDVLTGSNGEIRRQCRIVN